MTSAYRAPPCPFSSYLAEALGHLSPFLPPSHLPRTGLDPLHIITEECPQTACPCHPVLKDTVRLRLEAPSDLTLVWVPAGSPTAFCTPLSTQGPLPLPPKNNHSAAPVSFHPSPSPPDKLLVLQGSRSRPASLTLPGGSQGFLCCDIWLRPLMMNLSPENLGHNCPFAISHEISY